VRPCARRWGRIDGCARHKRFCQGCEETKATVEIGFKTDMGRSRKLNEDNLLVDLELGLFIVADGMGGHEAGELASSIAVLEIANHIRNQIGQGKETNVVVEEAIIKANAEIHRSGPTDLDEAEMGTTVVLALITGNRALISHVGDSRAYMITNGAMKQLTNDHTFVADWLREGSITVEEARTHDARHGLYAALGVEDGIEPETAEWPWDNCSSLLLCSDGLTEMVPEDQIEAIVNCSDTPQQACDLLVEAANEMGGTDNISVIIVRQAEKRLE
jgi:PPM family protein phosphatase